MEDVESILIRNHQEHILEIMRLCSSEQRRKLEEQVRKIDFEQIAYLYSISQKLNSGLNGIKQDDQIEPIKHIDKYNINRNDAKKLISIGEKLISQGKYAVVTMAGGQGTRLGHSGPKGTYLLNVEPRPKYLFEIIVENLLEYNKKYNTILNWYVMTSSENNEQTLSFLEEHNYFGYPKYHVMLFVQKDLPVLSKDGKLFVDEDFNIKYAASGHGSIYRSMKKTGVLEDMRQKGVEWVFIGGVDNVLLNMADPMLLGLTLAQENQIGSKTIVKANSQEKVGVFCKKNNVPFVIEYTEISDEMAAKTNSNNELVFGESHIMCNLYSLKALELIASRHLPYHSAYKPVDYIDVNGNMVKSEEPNAYKYESFLFDAFGFFPNISILRGRREEDFAPIKNKDGEDSPETAIELYNRLHKKRSEVEDWER